MARHLDAFDRHVRLAAGDVDGPEVFQPCIRFGDPVRHLHARRWNVGYTSERIEHLLERQVSAAENITFARAPAFGSEDVAFGAIAHVDQIHACVNVAEHFSFEKIDDDLSGRRRLDVEFAYGRRRIDDDDRKAARCPASDFDFREKLAALVMADHIVYRNRRLFIGGRAVVVESERADGAGIDDALDTFIECSLHYVARAVDVALVHLARISAPQSIICGAMINDIRAAHRLLD